MKKIVLFFIALTTTLAFVSCKKSGGSASSSYYFNAKFDGSSKDFSDQVTAVKSNLGSGQYSLVIAGITGKEEGALTLWSDKDDFTAGKTFSLSALNGSTSNEMSYVSPLGSSSANSQWNTTYLYSNVPESFQCTITEATTVYIKGTFSSVIYQNTDSAISSKTVTEGQFYAKF